MVRQKKKINEEFDKLTLKLNWKGECSRLTTNILKEKIKGCQSFPTRYEKKYYDGIATKLCGVGHESASKSIKQNEETLTREENCL